MPVKLFTTYIRLPPAAPTGAVMHEVFRRIFSEYRWFRPMRFGGAFIDQPLDPERIDYEAMTAHYEERLSITVAAATDRDFILVSPIKHDAPPFTGNFTWCTSVTEAKSASWRANHVRQVVALMQLLGSPLAMAGPDADLDRKTHRWVPNPDGFGSTLTANVRGYGEGLAGLFWRNFYGPPFVRMFGERLASVPPEQRRELEGGVFLVEPYALPTQAMTPEGDAAERVLIDRLGPECFYDPVRHLKPTRVPDLSSLEARG